MVKSKIVRFLQIVFLIFAVSFLINLFWEIAHSALYDWSAFPLQNDIFFYVPKILRASAGDGLIMIGIYGLGILKNRKINWISKIKISDYLLIIFLGLIISVLIEKLNVQLLGRWSYTDFMPIIPWLNVGLTPILQMLVLPLFIFKIISFFKLIDKFT